MARGGKFSKDLKRREENTNTGIHTQRHTHTQAYTHTGIHTHNSYFLIHKHNNADY